MSNSANKPTTIASLEAELDFADFSDPMYRALKKAYRATRADYDGLRDLVDNHPTINPELNERRERRLIDELAVLEQALVIRCSVCSVKGDTA
jgi:hypothetical protein